MSERPTQNELDKANARHAQDVLNLAEECGLVYAPHFQLKEFASKLRAKDAATISSLKAQLAEAQKDTDRPRKIHSCDIEGCAVCDPTHGL